MPTDPLSPKRERGSIAPDTISINVERAYIVRPKRTRDAYSTVLPAQAGIQERGWGHVALGRCVCANP